MKQTLRHFVPNTTQLVYCAIAALLLAVYWCRAQLVYAYTNNVGVNSGEVHESIRQALTNASGNSFVGLLPLIGFWMAVGLITGAILYESFNLAITAWNDYVVASRYVNARAFRRALVETLWQRGLAIIGFIVIILISANLMFGAWQSLICQPATSFLQAASIWKELVGLIGLTANLYLIWMSGLLVFRQTF